jgi:hypothetical protein
MVRARKDPRGGPRQGTPGTAYANRTDLQGNGQGRQPVSVPTGLPYGERQQLQQSQQAVPMAGAAPQLPPAPFNRPTDLPDQPVTHGLPFGPGGGPEVLGPQMAQGGDLASQLRGLLLASNNPDVAALIALAEQRQGITSLNPALGGAVQGGNLNYGPMQAQAQTPNRVAPNPGQPLTLGRANASTPTPPPLPPGWTLDQGGVPVRQSPGNVGKNVRTEREARNRR